MTTPKSRRVITVFSDITELRELRDTELRMARKTEEQHEELQGAYRDIEERNVALAAALRKVRVTQGFGIVLITSIFLGVGTSIWLPLDSIPGMALFEDKPIAAARAQEDDMPARNALIAAPGPISKSITLKGRLAPWRDVDVRSPAEAKIAVVHVRIGQEVSKGEVLAELDLSALERKYQSKLLVFLDVQKKFRALKNWKKGTEMTGARRTLTQAQLNLESEKKRIKKLRFLFKQGLVPAVDLEDAEHQLKIQLLDFEAAEDAFASQMSKGDEEALEAARLAMENARSEMLELRKQRGRAKIVAPFAGTILLSERSGKNTVGGSKAQEGSKLRAGARVERDEVLFRIGDFSRIAVVATTDEIDVVKLRAGQQATVTGNAFPGLKLHGVLRHVSAQDRSQSPSVSRYDVTAVLDKLEESVHARLRIGMSGELEVVTYNNVEALLVPIEAVRERGGKHLLRVLDPDTGEFGDREVAIGPTTPRRVEITSGLKPGERIALPGG